MDKLQEIDLYFNQLKELRNATITYAQMAKRDKNRPPVRPICRRLGVNKLSEIKSDSDLYEAVCCYVFDECDDDDNGDIISERRKDPSVGIPHTQLPSQQPSPSKPFNSSSPTVWSSPAIHTPGVTSTHSDSQNYDEHVPPIPEFRILLDCVLAVRVSWDRYNRLDVFAHDFNIDQNFLLNCLKSVCGMIGCIRLDLNIDIGAVMNAVENYYQALPASRGLSGSSGIPSQVRQQLVKYPSNENKQNGTPNNTNTLLTAHSTPHTHAASTHEHQQLQHKMSSPVVDRGSARTVSSHANRTPLSSLESPSRPPYVNHNLNSSASPVSHQMNPNSRVFSPYTAPSNGVADIDRVHDDVHLISIRSSAFGSNYTGVNARSASGSSNPSELSTPYISPRAESYVTPMKAGTGTGITATSLTALRATHAAQGGGTHSHSHSHSDLPNGSSSNNNELNYNHYEAASPGASMKTPLSASHMRNLHEGSPRESLRSHATYTTIASNSSTVYTTRHTSFDNSAMETTRDSLLSDSNSSYQSSLKSTGLLSDSYVYHNSNKENDRKMDARNLDDRKFDDRISGHSYLNTRGDIFTTPSYTSFSMSNTLKTNVNSHSHLIQQSASSSSSSATTAENNSRFESGGGGTFMKSFGADESFVKVNSSTSLSSAGAASDTSMSRLMDVSNMSMQQQSVQSMQGVSSRKNTMDGLVDEDRDVILPARTRSSTVGTSSSGGAPYEYEYMSPTGRLPVGGAHSSNLSAITGALDHGHNHHALSLLNNRNSSAGVYTHERMLGGSNSSFFSSPYEREQVQVRVMSPLSPVAVTTTSSTITYATHLEHGSITGVSVTGMSGAQRQSSSSPQVSTPKVMADSHMLPISPPYAGSPFLYNQGLDSRKLDFDSLATYTPNSTPAPSAKLVSTVAAVGPVTAVAVEGGGSSYDIFWNKSYELIKSSMQLMTLKEALQSTVKLFKELNTYVYESIGNGSLPMSVCLAHRIISQRVVDECCYKLYLNESYIKGNHIDDSKTMMKACVALLEHQLQLQKQLDTTTHPVTHIPTVLNELHQVNTQQTKQQISAKDEYNPTPHAAGVVISQLEEDIALLRGQLSCCGCGSSSGIHSGKNQYNQYIHAKEQENNQKWMRSLLSTHNDNVTILNQAFLDLSTTLFLPTTTTTTLHMKGSVDIKDEANCVSDFDVHTEMMKFRLHSHLLSWRFESSSAAGRGEGLCLSGTDAVSTAVGTNVSPAVTKYEEYITTHGAVMIGFGDMGMVDVDLLASVTCTQTDWTQLTRRRDALMQIRALLGNGKSSGSSNSNHMVNNESKSLTASVHENESELLAAAWRDERAMTALTDCLTRYRHLITLSKLRIQNSTPHDDDSSVSGLSATGGDSDYLIVSGQDEEESTRHPVGSEKSIMHSFCTEAEVICKAAERMYPLTATTPTSTSAATGTGTDTALSPNEAGQPPQGNHSQLSSHTELDDLSLSLDKELASVTMATLYSSSFKYKRLVYLKSVLAQTTHILNQRQVHMAKHLSEYLANSCGYMDVVAEPHRLSVGKCILTPSGCLTDSITRRQVATNDHHKEMIATTNQPKNQLHTFIIRFSEQSSSALTDATAADANNEAETVGRNQMSDVSSSSLTRGCLTIVPHHHPFYVLSSHLIAAYFRQDLSEKLRIFSGIIHRFVKENQLNTELSSYAWNILIIHYLLKFDYVINIHDQLVASLLIEYTKMMQQNSPPCQKQLNEMIQQKLHDISSHQTTSSSSSNSNQKSPEEVVQTNVNNTSVYELLTSFFHYYSYEFDIFQNIVTVRGQGESQIKSDLLQVEYHIQDDLCAWRLMIEDMLFVSTTANDGAVNHSTTTNNSSSSSSNNSISDGSSASPESRPEWEMIDLGSSLTFTGQIEVFRTMRMAFHALYGMSHLPVSELHCCVEGFLISGQLLSLAVAGGYSADTESIEELQQMISLYECERSDDNDTSRVTHTSDSSDDPQQQEADRLAAVNNSNSDISIGSIDACCLSPPHSQSHSHSPAVASYVSYSHTNHVFTHSAHTMPPLVHMSAAGSEELEAILQQDDHDYDCCDQYDDYDQEVNNIISSAHSPN